MPRTLTGGTIDATIVLTPQSPEYEPTALDLLPIEEPTRPRWMTEPPPLPADSQESQDAQDSQASGDAQAAGGSR